MSQFMPYKKAAPLLGLTETALYNFIISGTVPACRVGGKRGRWYCNLEAIQKRLEQLAQQNVKDENKDPEDGFLYPKIRCIN